MQKQQEVFPLARQELGNYFNSPGFARTNAKFQLYTDLPQIIFYHLIFYFFSPPEWTRPKVHLLSHRVELGVRVSAGQQRFGLCSLG